MNRLKDMASLRDSFPTLRGRFPEGRFDAQEVADFVLSPAATTGSSHAAKFVLSVWNGPRPVCWNEESGKAELDEHRWPWRCLPFDMHAALQGWDDAHRNAFSTWARDPWWA